MGLPGDNVAGKSDECEVIIALGRDKRAVIRGSERYIHSGRTANRGANSETFQSCSVNVIPLV